MRQTRKFIGLARCPSCGNEFPMTSGVHRYCTPRCRPAKAPKGLRKKGSRSYTCCDCGIEGVAGKAGPLPLRCPKCRDLRDRYTQQIRGRRRRVASTKTTRSNT